MARRDTLKESLQPFFRYDVLRVCIDYDPSHDSNWFISARTGFV
jgi:hypothetical protein